MDVGIKRGALPEEELTWLRQHLRCDSIMQLFRDYSEEFGRPYTTVVSFRKVLARYNIFPIIRYMECENLNRVLGMMAEGPVIWSFKGRPLHDPQQPPHWLWKWHKQSIRTTGGVMFREYPIKLRELQYGETLDSRDSDQDAQFE